MKLQPSQAIDHRRQRIVSRRIGPARVERDGRQLIDLASNDYLGLAGDSRLAEAACRAIQSHGTGAAASPVVSGHSDLHQQLGERIAEYKGVEDAVVFPCGFSTNLATLTALVGPEDYIVCDRHAHASLIDACRLTGAHCRFYRHQQLDHLEQLLQRAGDRASLIVTEGIFSMDGTCVDARRLLEIARTHDARVLVDEAHSNGVTGPRGAGLFQGGPDQLGVELIHVGTLSKTFASQGGFAAGDSECIDRIVNLGRPYLFSTSLAPASVAVAQAAIDIVQSDEYRRTALSEHRDRLQSALREQGWQILGEPRSPILGVLTETAEAALQLSSVLNRAGILAPAIRPPTVKAGRCRVRLSLSAALTHEDVQMTIEAFAAARARGLP